MNFILFWPLPTLIRKHLRGKEENLLCSDFVLGTLNALSHLIYTAPQQGWYFYFHFIDEKAES